MTRKRLRYSDLAASSSTPAEELPTPAPELPATESQGSAPEFSGEMPAPGGAIDAVADTIDVEPLSIERDDDGPLIDALDDRAAPVESSITSVESFLPQEKAEETVDGATNLVPTAPRARRNSTPVELARTLTAERLAARAKDGVAGDDSGDWSGAPTRKPVIDPHRTLRDRARVRSGRAELLMFRVGGERFAVELILVDEVVDLPVIHHVPEMPPAMLGVVTVRGSLTPVYSPQHALGLTLARRDAVLIFRHGAHRVGILIDDVDDAITVDMAELREKPAGEVGDNVLVGVIRLESTLVGIVDAAALITSCQSANILEPA